MLEQGRAALLQGHEVAGFVIGDALESARAGDAAFPEYSFDGFGCTPRCESELESIACSPLQIRHQLEA